MELLGDRSGAAPRLVDARLDGGQVAGAHEQLRDELVLLTRAGLVHADLSPYNVLWWDDRLWLIDLPQAVDLAANAHALDLLHHDVITMATWFGRRGLDVDGEGWFAELLVEALYRAAGRSRTTRAPPSGAVSIEAVPWWSWAIRRTSERPRPGAAGGAVAGAVAVEAGEALEDPLAVLLGDARPVVVDEDPHAAVADVDRGAHRGAGVAAGVVEQVAHGPPQLGAAAEHLGGGPHVEVDPHAGAVGHATTGLLLDELADVESPPDRCPRSRRARRGGAGR